MQQLEAWIEGVAQHVPIELFSFFGGAIEEIIAPIPSPLVMMTAGSLAAFQSYSTVYLLWIAVLGSLGKTAGTWVIYICALKAEDFMLKYFGKFLGIDQRQIDDLSKKLNQGWKDDVTLTVLRALPFMPSSILSVGCGLLKINTRTVLVSSLIGNFIRNLIFLYIGYAGKTSFENLLHGMDSLESVMKIVLLLILAGIVGWIYWNREKKPQT